MTKHVLVVADSLAFHGPTQFERPDDPRLYPNVLGAALGPDVAVKLVARPGWTARDAWWALTKDPNVWGRWLPQADGVVIGVGGMDQLPAAIPTYLREGIPYVRPGSLRRQVRNAYLAAAPYIVRATGGPFRQLPQEATDRYLTRCVEAIRHWKPDLPIALVGPSAWKATLYPSNAPHAKAVTAARIWSAANNVALVEPDPFVLPTLRDGSGNPDGMHWSFAVHAQLGSALAQALLRHGFENA
jgi:hypothetical protein